MVAVNVHALPSSQSIIRACAYDRRLEGYVRLGELPSGRTGCERPMPSAPM